MSSATPPAHYDSPWKGALSHAFSAFMAFFFAEQHRQIDWSFQPHFRDKELEQIGYGDNSAGMVADKLVEVRLRDGSRQLVLVHIEVQAQRDAALPQRILDYNYRIFKAHGQPVASLVLLADDDPAWRPHAFHNTVLGTVMGIDFSCAKLLDFAAREHDLLASRNPLALLTLAHLRTQQSRHDADQLLAAKWQLTRLLYQRGWSKRRIMVLFRAINWMMVLPEPQQQRYWQAIVKLEKERKMEWISPLEMSFLEKGRQKGLREGREAGRDEGREEGRREGAARLLELQLSQRFGPLPKTVRNRLARASLQQLEAWGVASYEAGSLKQVFLPPQSSEAR